MLYNWNTISNLIKNIEHDQDLETHLPKCDSFKSRTKNNVYVETPNTFISRCLWYSWVANKTAYELQYRQNTDIPWDHDEDEVMTAIDYEEQLSLLSSLQYNIYTNDGNCFIADVWKNGLFDIIKIIDYRNKGVNSEFSNELKTIDTVNV